MTRPIMRMREIMQLIEERLGLSAITLERAGLENIITQFANGAIDQYALDLRLADDHSPIWQRLIHAVMIGETYFMRDKTQFQILREHILPPLIHKRRQADDKRLTIWCMGCSTGEEPYSVAITLQEMLHDWADWRVNLLATDINQRALNHAQAGIYRAWSFRDTAPDFQNRYFTPLDDSWKINLSLRNRVSFLRMNALSGAPLPKVDIIFARHVLMYMSEDKAQQVETVLHDSLHNGGWLFLGQAEALRTQHNHWLLHMFPGKTIYQKIDPTATLPDAISYPQRLIQDTAQSKENDSKAYQLAVDAVHSEAPQIAEQHLSALLETQPDHVHGLVLLAALFASRGAYPEALTHIGTALAQNALFADAHYVRALVQLEQGATDNAVQSLSAAIYCNRNHALSAMMLGDVYYKQGKLENARR
ncbi:MAG: CheR family methyltransferase, partial [Chloroflexota bacterium]